MAAIELDELRVQFGSVTAVDEVSLTIQDGEFVVLLGPSGCGKTTTLRCIAGLETATSGRILFDAQPVEHLAPRQRQVAMVFQFVSLYPHLSVRENVAFPLKARGESKAFVDQKVDWVAGIFDIRSILDKRPKSLPPGDWQKAALARAMIRDPKVLLLDEPLAAIDEQFREEMRWELKHLQRELGTTTVHVTHDQREAMSLADRVVLMRDGGIAQAGTPAELYDDPVDDFAAVFIGSPSMNLIPAQMQSDGLYAGGKRVPLPNETNERVRSMLSGPVQLGIRPYDVTPCTDSSEMGAVEVSVVDSYSIGREQFFDFTLGEHPMKGISKGSIAPKDIERVKLDPAKLLLFTADGGRVRV